MTQHSRLLRQKFIDGQRPGLAQSGEPLQRREPRIDGGEGVPGCRRGRALGRLGRDQRETRRLAMRLGS